MAATAPFSESELISATLKRPSNPSCVKLILKCAACLILVVFRASVPIQVPEFVYILVTGAFVSYGFFGKRRVEKRVENPERKKLSSDDLSKAYTSKVSNFDFASDCGLDYIYKKNEMMRDEVVPNDVGGWLGLPVRSLKSASSGVAGFGSAGGDYGVDFRSCENFGGGRKSSRVFGELKPLNLLEKFDEAAGLDSPPWRSRVGTGSFCLREVVKNGEFESSSDDCEQLMSTESSHSSSSSEQSSSSVSMELLDSSVEKLAVKNTFWPPAREDSFPEMICPGSKASIFLSKSSRIPSVEKQASEVCFSKANGGLSQEFNARHVLMKPKQRTTSSIMSKLALGKFWKGEGKVKSAESLVVKCASQSVDEADRNSECLRAKEFKHIVSHSGTDLDEVDKKASEFIAKFREQMRLQKFVYKDEVASNW